MDLEAPHSLDRPIPCVSEPEGQVRDLLISLNLLVPSSLTSEQWVAFLKTKNDARRDAHAQMEVARRRRLELLLAQCAGETPSASSASNSTAAGGPDVGSGNGHSAPLSTREVAGAMTSSLQAFFRVRSPPELRRETLQGCRLSSALPGCWSSLGRATHPMLACTRF